MWVYFFYEYVIMISFAACTNLDNLKFVFKAKAFKASTKIEIQHCLPYSESKGHVFNLVDSVLIFTLSFYFKIEGCIKSNASISFYIKEKNWLYKGIQSFKTKRVKIISTLNFATISDQTKCKWFRPF